MLFFARKMIVKMRMVILSLMCFVIACSSSSDSNSESNVSADVESEEKTMEDTIHYPDEAHFASVSQLTFDGENAEAYYSFDNNSLVFQYTNNSEGIACDQIFIADLTEDASAISAPSLVSTGKGRTTCAYFMPGDSTVIFSSTHLSDEQFPEVPDRKKIGKYVWPVYTSYEIFISDLEGNILQQLTNNNHYDAEAVVSPKGDKIVFTSTRNGDLDVYTMNIDGSDVRQITFDLGYDGGAFFSPDGEKLVFRASRPETQEEVDEYKDLFAQNMVTPTSMELFICDVDGTNMTQVTDLGQANWAPYFHPSGDKIIFSSNHESQRGFPFNLYLINTDGGSDFHLLI